MSTAEIRKILHDKIDTLDDEELKKLQSILNQINAEPVEWNLREEAKQIVNEKTELLSKLAK